MCTQDEQTPLTHALKRSYSILFNDPIDQAVEDEMIGNWVLFGLVLGFSYETQSATRQTKAKVQAQSNQIAPDIGNQKGNRYWGQFDGEYHSSVNNYKTASVISARITDAQEFLISVPEVNINYNGSLVELHAGRFIVPWSPIDRNWNLGYINNRKNFTFYNPGEEGLVGVMAGLNFDFGLYSHSFASFVYIPELNPSQTVENGQVTSKSIWNSPVPKYAEINGVLTPIRYYLNKPDILDLILRPSLGQKVGYGHQAGDFRFDLDGFYMWKPENTIRAGGDARLTTGGEIIANINAKLYYEEVYGTNFTTKYDDYSAYVSWIRIDPKNAPANDPLFVQYIKIETQLEARNYGGLGIAKHGERFTAGVNWIALLTAPKTGNDLLGNKSRFREALDVFLTWKITEKLTNTFDIKFDVMKRDKIIMEEIGYEFGRGFVGSLGANLIDAPKDSSYWAKFRANDAVYANMAYNF